MIESFRDKALKRFNNTGSAGGNIVPHQKRLRLLLTLLNAAETPKDLNQPGLKLHRLKGNRKSEWAISVSRNWRLVFRFEDRHVVDLDLEDYH